MVSQNKYYDKEDILGHGQPPHQLILEKLVKEIDEAKACEVPVFLKVRGTKLETLLGHIDLLVVVGDTVYVCDYKPDLSYNSKAAPYMSFINSVPQVAAYALVLKSLLDIKNVKFVIFNQKGAWMYDPEIALDEITTFMEDTKEDANLPWVDYMSYM